MAYNREVGGSSAPAQTTHERGQIGVARVTADLIEQGWQVLIPLSSVSPFDLVAYRSGVFHRVQAKYCTASKGFLRVDCSRQSVARRGNKYKPNTEIDKVGIYCPTTGKCYYVKAVGVQRSYTLRITASRRGPNQFGHSKNADDFTKF